MAVRFSLTERLQLFSTVPGCKNERRGSTVSSYDSSALIKLPTLRCRTEPRVSSPRSFKNVLISSSAFPNRAPHYVSSFPALPPVTSLALSTGNLTKHMKSKAHSKKCMEMGVPAGAVEDPDAEDSGTKLCWMTLCLNAMSGFSSRTLSRTKRRLVLLCGSIVLPQSN